MSIQPNRSEQVVEDFKQRKLAQSALRRIREMIRGFEAEHAFDRKAAGIGVIALVVIVAVSLFFLFSSNSITLG
jgi:hypothetical protein